MARDKIWIDAGDVELILTVSQLGTISRGLSCVTYIRTEFCNRESYNGKSEREIVYISAPDLFSVENINLRVSEDRSKRVF